MSPPGELVVQPRRRWFARYDSALNNRFEHSRSHLGNCLLASDGPAPLKGDAASVQGEVSSNCGSTLNKMRWLPILGPHRSAGRTPGPGAKGVESRLAARADTPRFTPGKADPREARSHVYARRAALLLGRVAFPRGFLAGIRRAGIPAIRKFPEGETPSFHLSGEAL